MLYQNLQILIFINKKPRTYKQICDKCKLDKEALNQLLSLEEMKDMYYSDSENCNIAKYKTTFKGETIVRSELSRRHEVLFTRVIAIISLIASLSALILQTPIFPMLSELLCRQ